MFAGTGPVVGLWTAEENALVCPAAHGGRTGFAEAVARSATRGWPIATRTTGGGAVPQGPGILNFALAVTVEKGFTIEDGYRLITRAIRRGLGDYGQRLKAGTNPGSFCDGKWNLSLAGRKFVGTAQRWRPSGGRVRILAHALVLVCGPVHVCARAVDAYHQDSGLEPVRAEAHTTLETELGPLVPSMRQLADALHSSAFREMHETVGTIQFGSAA